MASARCDDAEASGEAYRGLEVRQPPGVHEHCARLLGQLVPAGGRVLDAGAGQGAFAARLLDLGYQVSACDMEPDAYRAEAPFTRWTIGGEPPPEALGTAFDGIVHLGVLEHLEHPRRALRDFFALLRPGGRLLLALPNVSHPYSRFKFLLTGDLHHFEARVATHISPMTRTTLGGHLRSAGYEDVAFSYGGRLRGRRSTMVVYRALEPGLRLAGWLPRPRDLDGTTLLATARRPQGERP